jgi:hypothetical protein
MRARHYLGAAFLACVAVPANASQWRVLPAAGTVDLTYEVQGAVAYRFSCGASGVRITQYGVTQLMDVATNQPVPDRDAAEMPSGASFMALATDKAKPNMVPAESVPNAGGGWDMAITIAKNDPSFLSLPRAGMMSVFSTGFTRAVMLGKEDRKLLAGFVKSCRSTSS